MRRGPHGGPRGKEAKAQDFWGTTGRLFSYLRPWAWGMIFSIVLAIISVILSIVSPKILGQATMTIYQGIMKGYAQMKAGQHLTALPTVLFASCQMAIRRCWMNQRPIFPRVSGSC